MKPIKKQIILITGSTDGIGELTAHNLAEKGARVLIHGRDEKKTARVAEEVRSRSGNTAIEEYTADLSSLETVRRLAENVLANHPAIDVLINNAGIGFSDSREISKDGYELRFAVNYLAPFLLTHLLLPALKQAAPARIVNVASAGQQTIDFNNVMLEKNYEAWRAYRQSKLALISFTIEMAGRIAEEGITVNSLHPGTFLRTKMVTNAGINPMGEPESGAEAVAWLASSPDLSKTTGRYFDRKTEATAEHQAYDPGARKKLWEISMRYTGLQTGPG